MPPKSLVNLASGVGGAAILIAAALAAFGELGFSRSVTPGLVSHFERLFGKTVPGRLQGWKDFVKGSPPGDAVSLQLVNAFFNRIPGVTDLAHWGTEDYWATPAETLSSNGADCEDYTIAKYYALKELGVPIAKLRMVYAKSTRSREAHMVLAYYPEPRADPLVLDNLDGTIRPASERPDLIPVYTFNDEDLLFSPQGAPTVKLSATSNRKWRDVQEKLERERKY